MALVCLQGVREDENCVDVGRGEAIELQMERGVDEALERCGRVGESRPSPSFIRMRLYAHLTSSVEIQRTWGSRLTGVRSTAGGAVVDGSFVERLVVTAIRRAFCRRE